MRFAPLKDAQVRRARMGAVIHPMFNLRNAGSWMRGSFSSAGKSSFGCILRNITVGRGSGAFFLALEIHRHPGRFLTF